jgi:urease accessory protein
MKAGIGIAFVTLFFAAAVRAHHIVVSDLPRSFGEGFLSGLCHPVICVDHLAFIVAAGFFLALIPRGIWGIVALVGGSLAGAALDLADVELPGGDAAVALSVVLIGGFVVARRRIEFHWVMGGLALAGLLHGHSYAKSIFGAEPAPLAAYLLGFTLIQAAIAASAFFLHRHLPQQTSMVLGSVVGAIGLIFLVTV